MFTQRGAIAPPHRRYLGADQGHRRRSAIHADGLRFTYTTNDQCIKAGVWTMKQERPTPQYTTSLADVPVARA